MQQDACPGGPDPVGPIRPLEWTAGVDYYRWQVTDRDGRDELLAAVEEIQREDLGNGEKRTKHKFQQCEGKATPRVRYALGRGVMYVETSGEWCDSTWRLLPRSSGRLTRIDLQSTWRLSQREPGLGTRFLPPEETTPRRRLPNGKPLGRHFLPDGGFLGTVGARTAPEYFRVYDKGVEQRTHMAGELWRLELEVKYAHAEEIGCKHMEEAKVPTWCGQYAISRWLQSGLPLPLVADVQLLGAAGRARRPLPSYIALLDWMKRTVRPVAQRMVVAVGPELVLETLGLETWCCARRTAGERR
jgi:hypothetical protein